MGFGATAALPVFGVAQEMPAISQGSIFSAMIKNQFDDTVVSRASVLPGNGCQPDLRPQPVKFYGFRRERAMITPDYSGGPWFTNGEFAGIRSFDATVNGITGCPTGWQIGCVG